MEYTSITAVWTGAIGLPGYSKFRFNGSLTGDEAGAAAGHVADFFTAIKLWIPSNVTITMDGGAEVYDLDTGLIGVVTYIAPDHVQGLGSGAYAGGSGAVVRWLTGNIVRGRRVSGRTFLVPLTGAFDPDGSLSSSALFALHAAALALEDSDPSMVVVSQPVGGPSGLSYITGVSVPDRAAQLRSRR